MLAKEALEDVVQEGALVSTFRKMQLTGFWTQDLTQGGLERGERRVPGKG